MTLRLIFALTIASCLFGQPGPGPAADQQPATPTALITALTLNDTQVASLTQLQTQKRAQIQPIAQQLADKQKAIHDALAKDAPDVNAIAAALVQAAALQKQIKAIESSYTAQALAILTAAQKTKLAELEKALALQDAVRQAIGFDLLTPPEPPAGAGPGAGRSPAGMPGPGMMGFRGPMGMRGPMNGFRPMN